MQALLLKPGERCKQKTNLVSPTLIQQHFAEVLGPMGSGPKPRVPRPAVLVLRTPKLLHSRDFNAGSQRHRGNGALHQGSAEVPPSAVGSEPCLSARRELQAPSACNQPASRERRACVETNTPPSSSNNTGDWLGFVPFLRGRGGRIIHSHQDVTEWVFLWGTDPASGTRRAGTSTRLHPWAVQKPRQMTAEEAHGADAPFQTTPAQADFRDPGRFSAPAPSPGGPRFSGHAAVPISQTGS